MYLNHIGFSTPVSATQNVNGCYECRATISDDAVVDKSLTCTEPS